MITPALILRNANSVLALFMAATILLAIPAAAQAKDHKSGSHHSKTKSPQEANDQGYNDVIGDAAREMAVIYSQPNVSQTAYPVLPSKDRQYRYPNSLIPNQQQSPTIVLVPPSDTTPGQVLSNGKVHFK